MPQTTDQLKRPSDEKLSELHAMPYIRSLLLEYADWRDDSSALGLMQAVADQLASYWNDARAVPLVAEAPRDPPLPEGWATEALEAIWNAPIGTTITADMKRAASLALRVARGERWDDDSCEWVAPPVSVAPMPEEWLKEAERLVDETTEAAAVAEAAYRQSDEYPDYGKQVRELDAAKAALLSHIRTAPRPTLSDEPECACMCCKELAAMMANHATDFDYKRACQCAMYAEHEQCDCHFCKSVLASVAPQPEQPNTDSVHLAGDGRTPVQGLDAASGVVGAEAPSMLDALQQADAFLALLRGLFLSNAPQLATESDRRRLFEECVRIRTLIAATSGVQEVPRG